MIKKSPVVLASEMSRIEKLACSEGCNEEDFMEKAGRSIADHAELFIKENGGSSSVTLLTGKGNNAGDTYLVGMHLLQRGFLVEAFSVYPEDSCGLLCKKQQLRFQKAGGQIHFVEDINSVHFPKEGVILDGLVGTGFKDKAEGELAEAIIWANKSKLPILAVDIPSGLSGDTGRVDSVAIQATSTVYLEFPKIGFFLEQGWDHVGALLKGAFDLPLKYREEIRPEAFLVEPPLLGDFLLAPRRARNKYEAGYVIVLAGSYLMPGAGALSSYATLRSGAGIVRWFYPAGIENMIAGAPFEVIKCPLESSLDPLFEEMKRARALIVGPGMGRDKESYKKIKKVLSKCSIPSVIDADALFFLSKKPSFVLPANSLLTPHTGEMKRLLDSHSLKGDLLSACQSYVTKKNTTLLLKGAPNFLFSPGNLPSILPFGNPGMATAGSGDVLTGVLAALLSQKLNPIDATILGCYLHGKAGDLAAEDLTVFCLTASDILAYLPKAFASGIV